MKFKRWFSFLLVIAMLLCMTPAAFAAECSVELVFEAKEDEVDLEYFGSHRGWLTPEEGKQNVMPVYIDGAKNSNGYLKIENGKIIIEETNTKEESTYKPFTKNGKYGFRNSSGKVLVSPIYDEVKTNNYDSSFTLDYCNNRLISVRMGEKWGLMNTRGELILPLISNSEPDRMDYQEDYRLINTAFYTFTADCDYDTYYTDDSFNGNTQVYHSAVGLVDENGKIWLEPEYASVRGVGVLKNGTRFFVVSKEENSYSYGKYGIIDENGNEIIPFVLDHEPEIAYDHMFYTTHGKSGLVCNELFVIATGWMEELRDPLYSLMDIKGNIMGDQYHMLHNEFIGGYTNAEKLNPNRFYMPNDPYILDKSGNVILKYTYQLDLRPLSDKVFVKGNLSMYIDDCTIQLVNRNGTLVADRIYNLSCDVCPDGDVALASNSVGRGEEYYYVDTQTGKTVLGPYERSYGFANGFAIVTKNGEMQLIDRSGKVIFSAKNGLIYADGLSSEFPYFVVRDYVNENQESVDRIYKIHFSGTAVQSTSTVYVDGVETQFDVYAVADSNGNYTNYFKIRDLALALNGTKAQFGVAWDGAVNLIPGQAYTPTGVEGSTPFSGAQHYGTDYAITKVSGEQRYLDTITLRDSNGGGYTYYKLRDIGYSLGFDVSWDSTRGAIVIDTTRPYSDAS